MTVAESPAGLLLLTVNERLNQASQALHFSLISAFNPCPSSDNQPGPVDLVVLMDMSGSMADEALLLDAQVAALIRAATAECRADLRVVWLGIAKIKNKTNFTQTCRKYLAENLNIPRRVLESDPKDKEDGARSIIDLARYFDWRSGASRLLLFLGDEGLFQGNPQNRQDKIQTERAITVAQEQRVTVFTYLGTPLGKRIIPKTRAAYKQLASATGGQAYIHPPENLAGFQNALSDLVCATSPACTHVELPELRPCFELRWGEQADDRLETNEVQVLYLVVRNPYANITFKDLSVTATIRAGVATQQNSAAGVVLIPSQPICFSDLLPCNPAQPEQFSYLARELILVAREASSGPYVIELDYTCGIEISSRGRDAFNLTLQAG